jgi:DNA-binding IclR family transcriptional regulator
MASALTSGEAGATPVRQTVDTKAPPPCTETVTEREAWPAAALPGDGPAHGDGRLRSVAIAMDVLECFTGSSENGPSEIARQLGIAKSTASRMMAALASGGLLERRANGRYRLGLRLFEYGQLAADRLLIKEMGLPVLAELRDRVAETVQLGIPLGTEVLYIDRLEGTHGLRFHTEAFGRVPAHSSSSGKAIAAFNPYFARAVCQAGLRRRAPHTIVDPAQFRAALAEIHERGWVSSEEEFEGDSHRSPRPSWRSGASEATRSRRSPWPARPSASCAPAAMRLSARCCGRPRPCRRHCHESAATVTDPATRAGCERKARRG